jgi:hypothetical protein
VKVIARAWLVLWLGLVAGCGQAGGGAADAAVADGSDAPDGLSVDAFAPGSCRQTVGRAGGESHVLRFEAASGTPRVHLLRRTSGVGVGESWVYALDAMWIERDGACTAITGDALDYLNSHHNWRDAATGLAGGLEHRLALSYDVNMDGWRFELGITEKPSGRVVLPPTRLLKTGSPVGQWYGPGQVLVFVSEVMPENRSTWKDEAGDFDPWIELFNPSSEAVDLGGYFLSDDSDMRERWTFPAGTMIGRHQHVMVVADGQPAQGPLHASFRLAPSGSVVLTAPSGSTDGERGYGPLGADKSAVFSHETDRLEPSAAPTPGTGGF